MDIYVCRNIRVEYSELRAIIQADNSRQFPANHRDSLEFESGFVCGRDGFPLVVAPGWRFGLLALGPLLRTAGRRIRRPMTIALLRTGGPL